MITYRVIPKAFNNIRYLLFYYVYNTTKLAQISRHQSEQSMHTLFIFNVETYLILHDNIPTVLQNINKQSFFFFFLKHI